MRLDLCEVLSRWLGAVAAFRLRTASLPGGTITLASGFLKMTAAWTAPVSKAPSPMNDAMGMLI
jgi:hypothetical protein